MINAARDRLYEVDRDLDGPAMVRTFARHLARSSPVLVRRRNDPLVAALRAELLAAVLPPCDSRPSPAGERRAERCHWSFDEGYLLGRIALDTHRLAMRWSGLTVAETTGLRHGHHSLDEPGRAAARARLHTLRALVLSPVMNGAFGRTSRVVSMLRDLTEDTRGVPADLALQFAGLGFLTAVCEWTMVLSDHRPLTEVFPTSA